MVAGASQPCRGLRELWQVVPRRGPKRVRGAGARGRCGVGRSRGQRGSLACELPPALRLITRVLPPISEELTSNKRAL